MKAQNSSKKQRCLSALVSLPAVGLVLLAPALALSQTPATQPSPAPPAAAPAPLVPAPATAPAPDPAPAPGAPPAAAEPTAPAAAPSEGPPPVVQPAEAPPAVVQPTAPAPTGRAAPAAAADGGYNDVPDEGNLEPIKEPALFMVGLGWDFSLPLASTADFTNQFSVQGFSIEVKYVGLGKLEIGGLVAWHTLAEKGFSTYTDPTGEVTVSGTSVHEMSSNPLMLRAHYAFRQGERPDPIGKLVPYVAVGVGGSRVLRRIDLGIDRFTRESWHWAVGPEVGVELPLGPATLLLSSRLNYLFASGGGPEQLYLNFTVGAGLD